MAAQDTKQERDEVDIFGFGCVWALVAAGAMIAAVLISTWTGITILPEAEAPAPAAAAPAPAPEPEPEPVTETAVEAPEGAGVIASERDGFPMLAVYFDSGSTEVTPDFESVAEGVLGYLEANPGATAQISGFNDPTGDPELNAELSKNRAENVQAQLVALGVPEERTDLVQPDDTTSEELSNAEARRVEITIVE